MKKLGNAMAFLSVVSMGVALGAAGAGERGLALASLVAFFVFLIGVFATEEIKTKKRW